MVWSGGSGGPSIHSMKPQLVLGLCESPLWSTFSIRRGIKSGKCLAKGESVKIIENFALFPHFSLSFLLFHLLVSLASKIRAQTFDRDFVGLTSLTSEIQASD